MTTNRLPAFCRPVLLAALLSAPLVGSAPLMAQCVPGPHSGTIGSSQAWCLADSPHVLGDDVVVAAGATLTVEPGAVVLGSTNLELKVQGILSAIGTSAQPITFTAGAAWSGLVFDGGTGTLSHVLVEKGDHATTTGTNPTGITALNVPDPGLVIQDSTLSNPNRDLWAIDSVLSLTNVTFTGAVGGLYPLQLTGASTRLAMTGCSFSGNAHDQVLLDPGAMSGADVVLGKQPQLDSYLLSGDYTVPPGRTLSVQAGVTVKGPTNVELRVLGTLTATGTLAQPVTFTGDAAGNWSGLVFDGGTGTLSHVLVERGDHANSTGTNPTGITARNVPAPGLVIEESTFSNPNRHIWAIESVVSLTNVTFTGATGGFFPLQLSGAATRLSMSGCVFSGNARNRVLLEPGALTGADVTLPWQPQLDAYEVSPSYTVPAGRTLTVEPGVTVMGGTNVGLYVQGRLVARGTASQPITFTDSGSGEWTGVAFDGGTGELRNVVARHGGDASAIDPWRGAIAARNVPAPGLVIADSAIADAPWGLVVSDTVLSVTNTSFSGSSLWPMHLAGAATVLTASANRFVGNTRNRVLVREGAMTGADFTLTRQAVLEGYQLESSFTVPLGRRMSVEPGVTVMAGTNQYLRVQGRLEALGTADAPVVFTHDGSTQWTGVAFDGGTGLLRHAEVRRGGNASPIDPYRASVAARDVTAGEVRLESCRIVDGSIGVRGGNSRLVLQNTVVSDQATTGILLEDGSSLTALHTTLARNFTGVSVTAASAATFTNTVVASSTTGVTAQTGTAVSMSHTLWDAVPTQTTGPVGQSGFLTGVAAFDVDGFHLTASSAAIGQGVATSALDDFDGETRPRPRETLPDLGADETPWSTTSTRTATSLTLGTPLSGTAPNGTFVDFRVDLGVGQAPNLLVRLTPTSGAGEWRLLGRFRQFPESNLFDAEGVAVTGGARELLVETPTPGVWYLSVLHADQAGGSGSFQIVATAVDRHVSDVTPRAGGNTGAVTLNVTGAGFESGMTVQLRTGGVVLRSVSPAAWDVTQLAARLDLTGLAPQTLDVAVLWPDLEERVLSGAFQVQAGGTPNLRARLVVPASGRYGRATTLQLEYRNDGNEDMPAPLFFVESAQNVQMRLDGDHPWRREPLQILGVDLSGFGTAGTLPPGRTQRISFQVIPEGGAHEKLDWRLYTLSAAASTTAVDWASQEASFRTSDVPAEAWQRMWPLFTSSVGSTWGDYHLALRLMADSISAAGDVVYDPSRLLYARMAAVTNRSLEIPLFVQTDAAALTPGPALAFERTYRNGIRSRWSAGPLGFGWSHNLAVRLDTLPSGAVTVTQGGILRLFLPQAGGTWRGAASDHGVLRVVSGLFTLSEPSGAVFSFRADGLLGSLADGYGNRIDLSYDAAGRLTRAAHTNGDAVGFAYDPAGRIATLADQNGRETTYAYDASGELASVTDPDGRTTTYVHDGVTGLPSDRALVDVVLPDGSHRPVDYDTLGRLSGWHLQGGEQPVTIGYDLGGRVTLSDGSASTWTLTLDDRGQLGTVVDPLGRTTRYGYDPDSNVDRVVAPDGTLTTALFGPSGNLEIATDGLGQQTKATWAYLSSGGVFEASLTDEAGRRTLFLRDAAGGLTGIEYPDATSEELTRDARGLVTGMRNRRGQLATFTFDSKGRPVGRTLPDGSSTTYEYDSRGRMVRQTGMGGTAVATYDAQGFVSRIDDPSGRHRSYSYDTAGRRTQRLDDDGFRLVYLRDAEGRLVSVGNGAGTTFVSYTHDARGRVAREDRGNGTAVTYQYDPLGRVLNVSHLAPGGAVQQSYTYAYDAAGNPKVLIGPSGTTTYEYDVLSRLTKVTYPDAQQLTVSYDAAGNRLQVVDHGVATPWVTNALNQVTQAGSATFLYDGDGNLVSRTDTSGTTAYGWDANGHLARVAHPTLGTFEYEYDVLGHRVVERRNGVARRFVWDGAQLIAELDASGSLVARYVHAIGLVARVPAAGAAAYYGFDASGNTRLVTDGTGGVANTYDYSPWGVRLSAVETISNPFGFLGRYGVVTDPHGLVATQARPYDPTLGRFLAIDPIRHDGGPNLYDYCSGNPVRWVDPSGLLKLDLWSVLNKLNGLVNMLVGPLQGKVVQLISYITGFLGIGSSRYNASKAGKEGGDTVTPWLETTYGFISTLVPMTLEVVGYTTIAAAAGVELAIGTAVLFLGELAIEAMNDLSENRMRWAQERPLPNKYQYWWELYHGNPPKTVRDMFPPGWQPLDVVLPGDPNEKVGTPGTGASHAVAAGRELSYTVHFQNVPTASAPAQEVFVTDQLDAGLDWSTVRLTEIAWGSQSIGLSEPASSFAGRIGVPDWRPEVARTWWVDVTSELTGGGQLEWALRTIDPATGDLPEDPFAGFLPPDDATGRGQGHVSFAVRTKPGLAPGTLVANQASIVFDVNEPIATNTVSNTIGLSGDANGDQLVDTADVLYLVNHFYGGGPPPLGPSDANGDEQVTPLDVFYLINHFFGGGPGPVKRGDGGER